MYSYLTIKSVSEAVFKDKGSKFIAFAYPVATEEEALAIVGKKRKEFFDARHVCYAYMIGAKREKLRVNDDSEPSGTAGKPILGQINSKELTNILIVVIRYFGGVLLGTSGLINAYKTAAYEAIANAEIIEIDIQQSLKISCNYDNLNFVMRMIKEFDVNIIKQDLTLSCEFTVSCKAISLKRFLQRLAENHLIEVIKLFHK